MRLPARHRLLPPSVGQIGGRERHREVVAGAEADTTAFQFAISGAGYARGAALSEANGATTFDVPLATFSVRERLDLDYRPAGYKYLGHSIVGGDSPCADSPQSVSHAAQVLIDQNGEHAKVCFYNERLPRYTVRVPMVAKSITLVPGVNLSITLVSSEPVAGADGWSNYVITITNTGTATIDTSYLVLQSWYSADALLGNEDDCAAAGYVPCRPIPSRRDSR